jgi:hypothetical protein
MVYCQSRKNEFGKLDVIKTRVFKGLVRILRFQDVTEIADFREIENV